MDWKVFLLRVAVALVLGALIGAERQLRQRLTGLRTNALVSTGACLFVLMTQGVPGLAGDASRIAAYVVSGIGFLGGGVIMRDGLNVRGLNTAATLGAPPPSASCAAWACCWRPRSAAWWCSAPTSCCATSPNA